MLRPEFSTWTIGPTLFAFLESLLRPGMRTVECGSGLSTWLFLRKGCRHVALEHDPRYAFRHPCVRITPLTGIPPWYSRWPTGPFDVVLIDGPPLVLSSRLGVIKALDSWVSAGTIVVLDDTHREGEQVLAMVLSSFLPAHARLDLPPTCELDYDRRATVLVPKTHSGTVFHVFDSLLQPVRDRTRGLARRASCPTQGELPRGGRAGDHDGDA